MSSPSRKDSVSSQASFEVPSPYSGKLKYPLPSLSSSQQLDRTQSLPESLLDPEDEVENILLKLINNSSIYTNEGRYYTTVTSELNNLTCWLRINRLSLNVAKTELMIIGSRKRSNAHCEEMDILWNYLPQDLKSFCSIGQFKRGVKKVSEISDSHTAFM